MFILFSLFFWGLEIKPKKDANGNDIKPEGKYQHRIIPYVMSPIEIFMLI
jgi:hypothetical protein